MSSSTFLRPTESTKGLKARKEGSVARQFCLSLIVFSMEDIFSKLRINMVDGQLRPRGIKSEAVLSAMASVPRHLFVPASAQGNAYDDCPLPIGFGQTISQPYIVAYMTEQLEPKGGMKVLEIGTGSGYQAAVLAHLGCEVYTMELVKEHSAMAEKIFAGLGLDIKLKHGDGYSGWPEAAPFDAVIVTAAPEKIPPKLIEQLREGGKMIVPLGPAHFVQYLKLITKKGGAFTEEELLPVRFVPMVESQI